MILRNNLNQNRGLKLYFYIILDSVYCCIEKTSNHKGSWQEQSAEQTKEGGSLSNR